MPFDTTQLPGPPDDRAWGFVESFVRESEHAYAARIKALEIGADVVSPATGAALRVLARSMAARNICEIGTSTGGAALWLLDGAGESGHLTSIDTDGEHHRIAREIFTAAEVPAPRSRLITGRPAEVLPRMADGAYDMVVIATNTNDLNPLLDQAVRLLRLGGVIVLLDAFGGGKVGDPAQRDTATVSRRLLVQRIGNDPRLTPSLLPVGDGLLIAVVNRYDFPADL
jgi:predicted O-methyltransferase YrrM